VNDSSLFYWTNGGRFKSLENECKTNYCVNTEITGYINYIYGGNTWSTYQTSGNNFNLDFNSVNKVFVDTAGKIGATSLAFTSNLITNTVTLSSAEVSTLTGINTGTTIQAQLNAITGSGFLTKTGTTTGCSPTLQLNTNTSTFLINGYLGVLYPLFCVNFTTAGDTFIKNIHSTSLINSKSASYYDISSSIQGLLDAKISTNGVTNIVIPVLRFTSSGNYFQVQDEKSNELVSFTKTYNTFTQESYFNSGLSGQYSQMRFGFGTTGKSFMIRYDSADCYILISDTYNGIFNSLRPFFINATSGLLSSLNGQNFSGGLTSTGNIICNKSNASVRVQSGSYGCDFATNTVASFYLADALANDTCIVSNLSPIRLSGGSSLTTDVYIDNTLVTIKNRLDCPTINCSTQLWVGVPNSIWMTDLRTNLNTPSTTFGRYFGVGGVIYQDFYNQFQWRSSPTLNSANIHLAMYLQNRSTTKSDLTVNGNILSDDITSNHTIHLINSIIGEATSNGDICTNSLTGDLCVSTNGSASSRITFQAGALANSSMILTELGYLYLNRGLQIQGNIPVNQSTTNFYYNDNTTTFWAYFGATFTSTSFAIHAVGGRIAAVAFHLSSDARIKKDIEPISNGLEITRKLKPCSYKFIDNIHQGGQTNYGLIAQEVEQVLPECINTNSSDYYVPNIYKTYPIRGRTVQFDGLDEKTQKLKVYLRSNSELIVNVSKITKDSFDIDQDIDQDTLFIYGGLINDFKTINYQSITITNLGAIQELDKKIIEQEASLHSLESKINQLMDHLREMTIQLNSLTNLMKPSLK
jgi:hypothetical protein